MSRAERRRALPAPLFIVAMLAPLSAQPAEVTMTHTALERLVWNVLLTGGGQAYLEGSSADTCPSNTGCR